MNVMLIERSLPASEVCCQLFSEVQLLANHSSITIEHLSELILQRHRFLFDLCFWFLLTSAILHDVWYKLQLIEIVFVSFLSIDWKYIDWENPRIKTVTFNSFRTGLNCADENSIIIFFFFKKRVLFIWHLITVLCSISRTSLSLRLSSLNELHLHVWFKGTLASHRKVNMNTRSPIYLMRATNVRRES